MASPRISIEAAAAVLRTDGAETVEQLATHRNYAQQSLARLIGHRIALTLRLREILGEMPDVAELEKLGAMFDAAALDFDEAWKLVETDSVRLIYIARVTSDAVVDAERRIQAAPSAGSAVGGV